MCIVGAFYHLSCNTRHWAKKTHLTRIRWTSSKTTSFPLIGRSCNVSNILLDSNVNIMVCANAGQWCGACLLKSRNLVYLSLIESRLLNAHLLACTKNTSVSFSPDRWLVSKSTDRWYWKKKRRTGFKVWYEWWTIYAAWENDGLWGWRYLRLSSHERKSHTALQEVQFHQNTGDALLFLHTQHTENTPVNRFIDLQNLNNSIQKTLVSKQIRHPPNIHYHIL